MRESKRVTEERLASQRGRVHCVSPRACLSPPPPLTFGGDLIQSKVSGRLTASHSHILWPSFLRAREMVLFVAVGGSRSHTRLLTPSSPASQATTIRYIYLTKTSVVFHTYPANRRGRQ